MCTESKVPLSSCFYHFGDFIVPADTGDSWKDPAQKCLVADIDGCGRIDALAFRADYYGIWFGFQVDDEPLDVVHNGHCLQNMGLIGERANGMPHYLPYFNGPDDLAVASRLPVEFNKNIKVFLGNSHPQQDKKCIGLHIYVTGHHIEPAAGNLMDWSVVVPGNTRGRHANTYPSGQTMRLERFAE